ncbi:MAG: hypothetical protein A3B29_03610 [Candidatus Sungbacteria bacterium RIFCSPLOWO2_01_FULL_51_34]|nr:MAG: hypothetical protein A3B29_03610 [Candidatus Sungbacteria bacterium RIFCSPLOWO2_01_FULL_51_34]
MLRKFYVGIAALLLVGVLSGCDHIERWGRVDGIERVMMHSRSHFTLFIGSSDSAELKMLEVFPQVRGEVVIFRDVPASEKMWAEIGYVSGEYPRGLKLHIHSAADIHGGDWQSGKQSGSTNVLE